MVSSCWPALASYCSTVRISLPANESSMPLSSGAYLSRIPTACSAMMALRSNTVLEDVTSIFWNISSSCSTLLISSTPWRCRSSRVPLRSFFSPQISTFFMGTTANPKRLLPCLPTILHHRGLSLPFHDSSHRGLSLPFHDSSHRGLSSQQFR